MGVSWARRSAFLYPGVVVAAFSGAGVVFIYTPGDLITGDILNKDAGAEHHHLDRLCGHFGYYLIAPSSPIDK